MKLGNGRAYEKRLSETLTRTKTNHKSQMEQTSSDSPVVLTNVVTHHCIVEACREDTTELHIRNCRLYPTILTSLIMIPNAFNIENTSSLINRAKDLQIDKRR
jgi:hypothetical protein